MRYWAVSNPAAPLSSLEIEALQIDAFAWPSIEGPPTRRFDSRPLTFAQCYVSIPIDGTLAAEYLNQYLATKHELNA